jgi:hypothetical protein
MKNHCGLFDEDVKGVDVMPQRFARFGGPVDGLLTSSVQTIPP